MLTVTTNRYFDLNNTNNLNFDCFIQSFFSVCVFVEDVPDVKLVSIAAIFIPMTLFVCWPRPHATRTIVAMVMIIATVVSDCSVFHS